MILERMKMEDWFIKASSCKYNFSESGVPDFILKEFFQKTKTNKSIINNIYLGNNSSWGSLGFRKEVSRVYKNVKPDNLIITNGTSESLYIFFNIFLKRKSKVLLLHPVFPILYLIPQALGAEVYFLDVLQFSDKKELLKKLILKIKKIKPNLLIINIPHNPVGFAFNEKEMVEVARVAKRYKVNILFDEHYRFLPINTNEIFPSGYDVVSKFYKNVFAVGSVIKCAGIVGMRVGWLIANKNILDKVRDYKDYTTHCVPLISETIAGLAIRNIAKIAPEFIKRIKNNWLLLKNGELVKKKKILLNYELEGGCVCFLKIFTLSGTRLCQQLRKRYNISVLPGNCFSRPGYIRVNLSQNVYKFKYLLNCIKKVLF